MTQPALTLYAWGTPNGFKPLIALHELGLDFQLVPVNIGAGQQKSPAYLALNPNGRIPALVDEQGPGGKVTVWESGAILAYLAQRSGQLMPEPAQDRLDATSWLFWQMAGLGPMMGQAGHFIRHSEPIPYAIKRYTDETARLLGVMEARLAERPFLAGEYSVADIACFPWVRYAAALGVQPSDFPFVQRWVNTIEARPAVQRALATKF